MAEGRCNCGQIKVSIPALPEESLLCCCSNCRRSGSSVGAIIYAFDTSEVTINDPNSNLKKYQDNDTKSGKSLIRQFCGNCGCPIASLNSGDPPKVFLCGGLFEQIPAPGQKLFEEQEPSWMRVVKTGEKKL
ncbi:hypothetical protein yc1106_09326 [Curvularia clavata]|uniref:CENP-V/GFA domain-containing protein n=1 Tax=Curvularia clavata TaxID=95742 RepID=A0A9Q8ZHH4_CURCL|nr:hypothetical protein yc1106_09326 [Curvularia clavata]